MVFTSRIIPIVNEEKQFLREYEMAKKKSAVKKVKKAVKKVAKKVKKTAKKKKIRGSCKMCG